LVTRSVLLLSRADRGYDPDSVLTARVPLPSGYTIEQRRQLVGAVLDRLRAVPGVTDAAYGTALPFLSFAGFTAFTMRSPRSPDVELSVQAAQRIVSPDYFTAMRLRVRDGRPLTAADTRTGPPAVVVNRTFAQQYLGERPVGSHIPQRGPRAGGIRFADTNADWEVVGVVDDMREDMNAPPQPEVFASINQITDESTNFSFDPILIVRTTGDPGVYTSILRDLVREQAPTVALDSVMTMDDRVRSSLSRPRLLAVMLMSFALFSALIVGVGLYGVVSFSVVQRTREIGVRSALGAQRRDIIALVLKQTLWIAAAGIVLGLALAIPSTKLLSAFLYGIGPEDPAVLVGVPVVILVVVAAACLMPARRAVSIGPLVAIRAK
jgi:putative ABC transport system permease protein